MSNWKLLAAVAVLTSFTMPALAGFTSVGSPTKGQLSQEQILEGIYGVNFAEAGKNFTSGTIQATRMDDSSGQVWSGDSYTATAKGRFASIPGTVSFGTFSGSSGGSYQKLFDVTGYGLDVTGSSGTVSSVGQSWRWGESRSGTTGSNNFSSLQSDNGGKDYLVAYRVAGLTDEKQWTTWLLFWENTYGGKDGDFNDLVVEVKAATMPAPGAIVLGIVGLCLVGYYQRQRINSPAAQ